MIDTSTKNKKIKGGFDFENGEHVLEPAPKTISNKSDWKGACERYLRTTGVMNREHLPIATLLVKHTGKTDEWLLEKANFARDSAAYQSAGRSLVNYSDATMIFMRAIGVN